MKEARDIARESLRILDCAWQHQVASKNTFPPRIPRAGEAVGVFTDDGELARNADCANCLVVITSDGIRHVDALRDGDSVLQYVALLRGASDEERAAARRLFARYARQRAYVEN